MRRTETLAAMGSLVAGVAHEVRNPLFSMSATLDVFEARFDSVPQLQHLTASLRGQVQRMTDLMSELLEFGRPRLAEPAPGSVREVVTEALESCAVIARQAGVTIRERFEPALQQVMMERRRLVLVFRNLIENAIQHSPRHGVVSVEARLSRDRESRSVQCTVRDSGAGLPEDDLARLFQPFFTRRRGGTGLGLSIAQKIVGEHGGRIDAANHPEGGAVMRVSLPAAEGRRRRAQLPHGPPDPGWWGVGTAIDMQMRACDTDSDLHPDGQRFPVMVEGDGSRPGHAPPPRPRPLGRARAPRSDADSVCSS